MVHEKGLANVPVQMGDEDLAYAPHLQTGLHELMLGCFASVEDPSGRAFHREERES